VATRGGRGLDDTVSDIFGKATTFTLIDVEKGEIKKVEAIQNPASSYKCGAGPIAVKTLADLGVGLVVAGEFGPSASTLLEQHRIKKVKVEQGTLRMRLQQLLRASCISKELGLQPWT